VCVCTRVRLRVLVRVCVSGGVERAECVCICAERMQDCFSHSGAVPLQQCRLG